MAGAGGERRLKGLGQRPEFQVLPMADFQRYIRFQVLRFSHMEVARYAVRGRKGLLGAIGKSRGRGGLKNGNGKMKYDE